MVDLSGQILSSLSLDEVSPSSDEEGSLVSRAESGDGCFWGSTTGLVSTFVSALESNVDGCDDWEVWGCCLLKIQRCFHNEPVNRSDQWLI